MADLTASFMRTQIIGSALFFLLFFAVILPHVLLSGQPWGDVFSAPFQWSLVWFVPLLVAFIVAHEFLHGVGFHFFGGVAWRNIRFGVKWSMLTPFAATSKPMSARAYRGAVTLPLALAVPAAVIGTAISSSDVVVFSAVMTGASAGDLLVLWMMRRVPPDALVRDATDRVGCEVILPGEASQK